MTKSEEQKLIRRVEILEKELSRLYSIEESKILYKHIYTIEEVAKILEVTPQAVYAMVERNEIMAIKIGRIKIPGEEVKRILGIRSEMPCQFSLRGLE